MTEGLPSLCSPAQSLHQYSDATVCNTSQRVHHYGQRTASGATHGRLSAGHTYYQERERLRGLWAARNRRTLSSPASGNFARGRKELDLCSGIEAPPLSPMCNNLDLGRWGSGGKPIRKGHRIYIGQ